MRQLKIATQITNRDSQAVEKYLQEISKISMITPEDILIEILSTLYHNPFHAPFHVLYFFFFHNRGIFYQYNFYVLSGNV